jgi:hypothetical protein
MPSRRLPGPAPSRRLICAPGGIIPYERSGIARIQLLVVLFPPFRSKEAVLTVPLPPVSWRLGSLDRSITRALRANLPRRWKPRWRFQSLHVQLIRARPLRTRPTHGNHVGLE